MKTAYRISRSRDFIRSNSKSISSSLYGASLSLPLRNSKSREMAHNYTRV